MAEHSCGLEPSEAENEELFSGLIDGVLTQADAQRMRLRLESCQGCGAFVEELRTIRANAQATSFKTPEADSWDERPIGAASRFLRTFGWLLVGLWLVINVVLVVRMDEISTTALRVLLGLSFAGWAALLLSVLIDRLKNPSDERYRRVVR